MVKSQFVPSVSKVEGQLGGAPSLNKTASKGEAIKQQRWPRLMGKKDLVFGGGCANDQSISP
jgi:hypothetical protein